ncbi:MAG: molybdopterin-dependent oxidoreductase [Inhella sp.]|uniref:molybdopterin-dependent oxidoreductase n=1 Tax=Inhella sp. TaxID=1921806 RepID=UPI0022C6A33B|nr:molybdopterin-dependent oxidoreductase [Inhella sp.]MCZ8235351.1 molybdopterin-dependent oxidoreductase [Inhella sp.]
MTGRAPAGHFRICPLCEAACGLRIETEGDQVVRIRGAEDDPFSQGYLCPKAIALKDLHEDPDRVRQPLVKRNGRFEPVTWQQALETIEARLLPILREHGPDAVAAVVGNPVVHRIGLLNYFPRLARALGTRNVFSASTLDQMPKQLSSALMFGHWLSVPVPDVDRTDFLLVLGANPVASNGSMWTVPDVKGRLKALRERGGRLVVVDPRRTETAELADQHLALKPGADAFLLMALAATLFEEGLTRPIPHAAGVDAVRDFVAPYPPERVAAACGLDAAVIRQLARDLAAAPRAAVYGRIGTCTQRFGTVNSWLVDVLNALTGHLDREGGAMFPKAPAFAANTQGQPGQGKGVKLGRRRSRVSGAPEVYGELPITLLAEEITTPGAGQVRALFSAAANPALSAPGGAKLDAALAQLDFMVSLDIYVNATTRHADVILPSPSALEVAHYDAAFSQLAHRNAARWSEPVFAKAADLPDDWEWLLRLTALVQGQDWRAPIAELDESLLMEALQHSLPAEFVAPVRQALGDAPGPARLVDLALRLGPYGDQFGRREGINLAQVKAAPAGLDLGPLQPRLPELLRTPSGRVELAPPELLAEGPALAAALNAQAPAMVVIGRRHLRNNNSWMHNLPTLSKGPDRCTLMLHPEDAARHGLRDGAIALIASASGQVQVPVEISTAMRPGVASLPHGFGHGGEGVQLRVAQRQPGANLNALLPMGDRDPLSGTAVLSGVAVTLAPAVAAT